MKVNYLNKCSLVLLAGVLAMVLLSGPCAWAEDASVYQQQIPEMTTLECAKCHVGVFTTLRDHGGLHQQPCRDCHEIFHTFTPGVPWSERVPACSQCHDNPHGEAQSDCLACHKNGHAPVFSLIPAAEMGDRCSACHQPETAAIALEGNAHGGQECIDCHQGERHGETPNCSECHEETHTPYVDNRGCIACHPPHEPNAISYGTDIDDNLCAGCHTEEFQTLQTADKKHKLLACVVCHPGQHGRVTGCVDCHANGPHNPTLLKNFSGCRDCHGNPHSLKL